LVFMSNSSPSFSQCDEHTGNLCMAISSPWWHFVGTAILLYNEAGFSLGTLRSPSRSSIQPPLWESCGLLFCMVYHLLSLCLPSWLILCVVGVCPAVALWEKVHGG
jgi:hypothetical protein